MSVKYFGQFLVDRGYLTPQQLIGLLEEENIKKLANLAVAKGVLLADEVAEILFEQDKVDFDFGEVGLKKKLLTREQLEYLRLLLKSDTRALCEAIVAKQCIDQDVLTFLIDEYKKDQEKFAIRPQHVPNQLSGRADIVALISMTENVFRQAGLVPVQARAPVVFSGRLNVRELTARIALSGDGQGQFVLSLDRSLGLLMAGALFGKQNLASEDLLYDSIREIANLIVGSAASAVSAYGHHMEFSPAEFFSVHTPFGLVLQGGRWEIQTLAGMADVVAE